MNNMKTPIEFKQNTVLLMVGPSGCGKSHMAGLIKNSVKGKVSIINSDELRRELLCENMNEMDSRMMSVSKQAFEMLESKLRAYTSYPVNHDLVIIDSTGLNAAFRERMRSIAKENGYKFDIMVFDYKNRADYEKYQKSEFVTGKHVRKLKQELSNLGKFDVRHRITDLNFDKYNFTIDLHDNYIDGPTLVIGDIHGCYDEFIELLTSNGVVIDNNHGQCLIMECPFNQIVLVGDYLDKAPIADQSKLVDFIWRNYIWIKCVIGNHEQFVVNYWNGNIKDNNEYFNSSTHTCEFFRNKVIDIYERSYPFLIGEGFIVTHSPCSKKYLGKTTNEALRAQRNFRYTDLTEEQLWEALSFLEKEDDRNLPVHIFGHIAFKDVLKGKSYLGIDTNAVGGGRLTGVIL